MENRIKSCVRCRCLIPETSSASQTQNSVMRLKTPRLICARPAAPRSWPLLARSAAEDRGWPLGADESDGRWSWHGVARECRL